MMKVMEEEEEAELQAASWRLFIPQKMMCRRQHGRRRRRWEMIQTRQLS